MVMVMVAISQYHVYVLYWSALHVDQALVQTQLDAAVEVVKGDVSTALLELSDPGACRSVVSSLVRFVSVHLFEMFRLAFFKACEVNAIFFFMQFFC